jgi:hypothetical protein
MGGRDQSERLVAINRNRWSQSAGAPTVLALGLGRRQRKDINARIAQASKLSVACRNRIVKLAGPAFLVTAGPAQGAHQISK